MNSAETKILFLQISEKFIEQITFLERQIDLLEESCLLATPNFINPLLLTNEKLENSIKIIKTANINTELPLAEKGINLVNLVKLASLKVFIAQNILVYIIKIPLVTKAKLDVYKVQ